MSPTNVRPTAPIAGTPGDPRRKDYPLFYEYSGGDTGRGVGASHQTGWTALATRCFEGPGTRAHRREILHKERRA